MKHKYYFKDVFDHLYFSDAERPEWGRDCTYCYDPEDKKWYPWAVVSEKDLIPISRDELVLEML